jgi:prophage antirepressor-like protein
MHQIITKTFKNRKVRTIFIENELWFVAKDVAEILGYIRKDGRIDTNAMIRRLFDDDIKEIADDFESSSNKSRKLAIINESGLYNSIFGSKLSIAKEFKQWVTSEILPEIRKTGSYSLQTKTSHDFDIKSYIQQNRDLIELIKLINSENPTTLHYLDKLTQKLNLESPVDLLEIDLNSYYFIPTELGKFLNKSAVEVNKMLEAKGYQVKVNGVWTLTESGKKYAIQLDNNFSTIKWKLESLI